MIPRNIEITQYFTSAEFMQIANAMREQGIIKRSFYMDIPNRSRTTYYNPHRFYWDETDPNTHIMVYGPIPHNDNYL